MSAVEPHPMIADARSFAEETLRPRAGEFDADGAVPRDVIDEMARRGYLGAPLPREFGGAGLDMGAYGRLTCEIGKGCSNARALLTVHASLVGETLARFGTDAQKKRFLPDLAQGRKLACFALTEPQAGSDISGIATSYRPVDGGFVLEGRKKWITYAAIADVFLVVAVRDGQGTAFLVERDIPGLSTTPMLGLLASRGAHIAEVTLDNVFVPAENLLLREGAGFSFVANTALFYGRYSIAWAGVSITEAAAEEMCAYARKREQFGRKIHEHQSVQALITEAVTAARIGRAFCEHVGVLRDRNDPDAIDETNIAKYCTSKLAMETALNAVQLFGGNGISSDYPVERLFREAKVLEIIEGSSQIQHNLISSYGLRRFRRKKTISVEETT